MMGPGGPSVGPGIVVAIIGLVGTIITTIGVIWSGALTGGGGNGGDGVNPPDKPEEVTYTIEVAADANFPAQVEVSVGGHNMGTIFPHQDPHQLTESVSPGQHSYTLTATAFGETPQYCEVGQEVTGSGNISIQEGDAFEVFVEHDCSRVFLNEMG
jgi:hypothetical protein